MSQQVQSGKEPIKVLVTGAAGQIAYSLIYMVSKGEVFGYDQPMHLVLLDIAPMVEVMKGLEMELMDCAFPLVKSIVATADEPAACTGVDAALLVGAMPRREGMERKDLLAANVKIFMSQGKNLNAHAKKDVKVIVVGNPANTNALICSKYAPDIPKENFSAMTRLDQNRARAQIAARCGVAVSNVQNVVIWGNHSSTQFPDVSSASVNVNGKLVSAVEAVKDDSWLKNEFIKTVQQRGAAVIKARKLSSAMSAAKACCDHMRDWWAGTTESDYVSMAVMSDGNPYGIEDDLMFSFPVRFTGRGKWEFYPGLTVDSFAREKLDATMKELKEERDMALTACKA